MRLSPVIPALLLATWAVAWKAEAGAPRRNAPPVPVVVAQARIAPVERVIMSAGVLRAVRVYRVHSELQGRLIELPYRPGDRVDAGALLARIDDTLIRAELSKAVAQREQAQADLGRMERLYARKGASEDELLEARTALAVARAEERLARARLERTRITAPFAGVVSQRLAEPGDALSPGTHLLTLIDPAQLEAELPVSDRLLPRLRVGQPVALRIDGLGAQVHEGHIARIHPEVDPETLKGTVTVRLDAPPQGAHPGQLARAELRLRDPPALRIPLAGLRRDAEGTWVWRVTADQIAERVPVQAGPLVGDEIVIRAGLSPGDRIVVRGFVRLRQGRKVDVVEDDGP